MFAALISWFLGGGLKQVTDALTNAYEKKLTAQTDQAKLEADQEIETLKAKRDVLVAEASRGGLQSWIRPLFAMPYVIYLWKVVAWDKVVCSMADVGGCSTDPLSTDLMTLGSIVVSGYFIGRTIKDWKRS
jgi:hypothetical protein